MIEIIISASSDVMRSGCSKMTAEIASPEESSEETGDDSSGEDEEQNEILSGDEVVYDEDDDEDMDDDSEDDDDDDDEDSDDSMHEDDVIVPAANDQEVKVEFEAFPPSDSDLEGLTALLGRLFFQEHINLHEMSEWIIGHNYIGSVLKTNNSGPDGDESDSEDLEADLDDTVYGVTTVISLKSPNGPQKNFKKQLLEYLEKNLKNGPVMDILNNSSNSVGLILTERFVNIPPLLAPPMLKCLNKEIESAIKKKMPYNFTHYMIISKSYDVSAAQDSGKKKASISTDGLPPCLEFINPEDEIFQQYADVVVSFPSKSEDLVTGSWGPKDKSMPQYRTVLLLSKAKFKSAVANICSVFTVENMMSLMAANGSATSQ